MKCSWLLLASCALQGAVLGITVEEASHEAKVVSWFGAQVRWPLLYLLTVVLLFRGQDCKTVL